METLQHFKCSRGWAAGALAALALALSSPLATATAEPIILKLTYFSSDRSNLYYSIIKPFVDSVNAQDSSRLRIDVYFSLKLGRSLAQQSQLARDGTADIAYVITPYEPEALPDSTVMELPGLFKNAREATRAYADLVASGAVRDFKDFFVIGVFCSEPESIHTRAPVASLAQLAGKRIRANNGYEASVLKKLGAEPAIVPINETVQAITHGTVDGATVSPIPMVDFGIGRVATNHYMLRTSSIPQALVMSRKRFDSLPADVQAIIGQYSGPWIMDAYMRIYETTTALVLSQLETDPRRKVTTPSQPEMQAAQAIFKSIIDEYAAKSSHNAELVRAAEGAIAKIRSEAQ